MTLWHHFLILNFCQLPLCLCGNSIPTWSLPLWREKFKKVQKWCTRLKSQSSCTAKHENNGTLQQTKCKDVFYEKGGWRSIFFRKQIVCKHVRSVWSDLCTEIQDWIIQKIQGWSLQRNTNLDNSSAAKKNIGGWKGCRSTFFSFPHYDLVDNFKSETI